MDRTEGSASSGKLLRRRIYGGDLREPGMRETAWAAMQGSRSRTGWRRRCRRRRWFFWAYRQGEGWPVATVVASDVGGGSRSWGGQQRSEGEGGPESEGEVREGRGRVRGAREMSRGRRRQPGREEVAGARGRARRARARPPGRGGRRQGGSGGGLGRFCWPPGGWASGKRQVSCLCSVFYFFSSVLFYLIYFATVLNLK